MDRHRWKNRVLLVETPNYKNDRYKQIKTKFNNNFSEYDRRYVKMVSKQDKSIDKISIKLIGFDGEIKKIYPDLNINSIKRDINSMPMGSVRKY